MKVEHTYNALERANFCYNKGVVMDRGSQL